jgi:integrase
MMQNRFDPFGNILPAGMSYLRGRASPYLGRFTDPKTGERKQKAFQTLMEVKTWFFENGMFELHAPVAVNAPQKEGISFDCSIRNWLEYWVETRSPSSAGRSARADDVEKVLIPYFGNQDVRLLSEDMVGDFVRSQKRVLSFRGRALELKTIRNRLSALNGFCEWLIREKIRSDNPCKIPMKRIQEDGKVRQAKNSSIRAIRSKSLNLEEARSLLSAAKIWGQGRTQKSQRWTVGEVYPCLFLLLSTGLRLGELCALRWKHIECVDALGSPLPNWMLRVEGKMTRTRNSDGTFLIENFTKGGSDRTIPMNSLARSELEAWRARAYQLGYGVTQNDPVFPIAQSYSAFKSMLRRVAESAKLPPEKWGAHSTRHTVASMLLLNGEHVSSIQRVLGHAHATTTEKYLHAMGSIPASVMDSLPPLSPHLSAKPVGGGGENFNEPYTEVGGSENVVSILSARKKPNQFRIESRPDDQVQPSMIPCPE